MIYCTDDVDHTVRKFTPEGKILMTLGASGRPSDTGAASNDFRTIKYAGPPFNFPTNVAFSPEGDFGQLRIRGDRQLANQLLEGLALGNERAAKRAA